MRLFESCELGGTRGGFVNFGSDRLLSPSSELWVDFLDYVVLGSVEGSRVTGFFLSKCGNVFRIWRSSSERVF